MNEYKHKSYCQLTDFTANKIAVKLPDPTLLFTFAFVYNDTLPQKEGTLTFHLEK